MARDFVGSAKPTYQGAPVALESDIDDEVRQGTPAVSDLYASSATTGRWLQHVDGTAAAPVNDVTPAVYLERVTNQERVAGEWNTGIAYFNMRRTGGSGYTAAVTGSLRVDGGAGHNIAVHGRARIGHVGGQAWGVWAYTEVGTPGFTSADTFNGLAYGLEVNITNRMADPGWKIDGGLGSITGMVVSMETATGGGNIGGTAVRVSRNNALGWHSGFVVGSNSILPTDTGTGNNEGFRANGATVDTDAYTAFRTVGNYFYRGLDFEDGDFTGVAIKLREHSTTNGQLVEFGDVQLYSPATNILMVPGTGNRLIVGTSDTSGITRLKVGNGGADFRGGPVYLPSYNAGSEPTAATWDRAVITVTDTYGQLAWSDGADWRRTNDVRSPNGTWYRIAVSDEGTLSTGAGESWEFMPADHGLLTWNLAITDCGNNTNVGAGVLYLFRVRLPRTTTVTNAHVFATAGGSSMTDTYVGLYDTSGTLLTGSADVSTAFQSGGFKTVAFGTAASRDAGDYYVGLLVNGTATPNLSRASPSSANNANIAAGSGRWMTSGTGQTALPASVTMTSASMLGTSFWAALS